MTLDVAAERGVIGDENDGPWFILGAKTAQNHFSQGGRHAVQGAFDDQHMRSGNDGAGKQQPEYLAQCELGALARHVGRQPFRHPVDFFIELDELKSPLDVLIRDGLPSKREVVLDRSFEQRGLRIQHQTAAGVDRVEADLHQVHVVVAHDAGGWREESCQQFCESAVFCMLDWQSTTTFSPGATSR